MDYKTRIEEIQKHGEELAKYVNSMHTFMTNMKHVAHMTQDELDMKDMVEKAQAAARGIVDNASRVGIYVPQFQKQYGNSHEELIIK